MNKKGDAFGFLMLLILVVLAWFAYLFIKNIPPQETKTSEQIALEKRERFLDWYDDENKYCKGLGFTELNDTYMINNCRIVVCQGETNMSTYSFCDNSNRDGNFGTGFLLGYVIGRR